MGRQMMILDIGAPVSIAGVSWMTQYLREFGLTIEEMKSSKCNQPFALGPSRRYLSQTLVELPVLVTKLDGQQYYPYLSCGCGSALPVWKTNLIKLEF